MFSIDISKIVLPDEQTWLIEAMQASGYRGNFKGVCFGLAHTLKDAALAGQFNTAILRLVIIECLQTKKYFPQVIEDFRDTRKKLIADLRKKYSIPENDPLPPALTEEKEQAVKAALLALPKIEELRVGLEKIIDEKIPVACWSEEILPIIEEIPAFFDKINLYQNPLGHLGLFPKQERPNIQDEALTTPFIISREIEESGGVIQAGSFRGTYTEKDLIDFFSKFAQICPQTFQKQPRPTLVIIAKGANHTIALIYDSQLTQWLCCDPNYLSGKFTVIPLNDSETLAKQVHAGLSKNGVTILSPEVYVNKLHESESREFFSQWKTTQQQAIHRASSIKSTAIDTNSMTPLHLAAINDLPEEVRELLQKGENANATNKNGFTALILATESDNVETVNVLLSASEWLQGEINIDASGENGYTALHYAAANGSVRIVSNLLAADADVGAINQDGCTPLHLAAENGHAEVVLQLLQNGANVDEIDETDMTPLHYAAANGHEKVALTLLKKRADINAMDENGNTPLDFANTNNQKTIQRLLTNKTGRRVEYENRYSLFGGNSSGEKNRQDESQSNFLKHF